MSLKVMVEEKQPGVHRVSIFGSLDSDSYGELEKNLKPVLVASTQVLILDLGGLDYISSMGLNVVFKAKAVMEKNKGVLMMVNLQPQIKKVFDVVKAIPSMDIFASMEEADNYLAKIQRGGFTKSDNEYQL